MVDPERMANYAEQRSTDHGQSNRVNRDRGLQSAVQGNLRNTESICRSYEKERHSISISYGDISKFTYVAIHPQGELS